MNLLQQVVGQTTAKELLQAAIERGKVAPAYLFSGASGIGKALTAKGFAQLILSDSEAVANNNHPDFLWVTPTYQHQGKLLTEKEAAEAGIKRKSPPRIPIEQIREITRFLSRPPLKASRNLVVIESAHTMAEAAANALLKTLEEPGTATIILISPSSESLLPTLVSRCQKIPFYRLQPEEMQQVLENYPQVQEHPDIIELSGGSPGEAIASLEHFQALSPEFRNKLTQLPTTPLAALLLAKEIDATLELPTQLWLVDYLQYQYFRKHPHTSNLKVWETARRALLNYTQSRLVWEVTLLKMIYHRENNQSKSE